MTPSNLAIVWGPTLLRPKVVDNMLDHEKQCAFVASCIENFDEIFSLESEGEDELQEPSTEQLEDKKKEEITPQVFIHSCVSNEKLRVTRNPSSCLIVGKALAAKSCQ
jgi:hypothetical protein